MWNGVIMVLNQWFDISIQAIQFIFNWMRVRTVNNGDSIIKSWKIQSPEADLSVSTENRLIFSLAFKLVWPRYAFDIIKSNKIEFPNLNFWRFFLFTMERYRHLLIEKMVWNWFQLYFNHLIALQIIKQSYNWFF